MQKINQVLLFFYLILPGITGFSDATAFDNKTEIIIIGTVHKSTHNFDADTLLNIFNRVNPDVILVECDSSYMTADFRLKDDIKYMFPETIAITNYSKNKSPELRPYDIAGRDIFLNNYKRKRYERNFFNDIYALSRNGNLNNEATDILNKVLSMMSIAEEMANEKVSYINDIEGSKKIDTINYYSYTGLTHLIDFTPELSAYKSYWDDEHNYWKKRNDVMLENILSYKNQFEGKRIIVLCGFSHKNILKNGLLKEVNENLTVKEFWEN